MYRVFVLQEGVWVDTGDSSGSFGTAADYVRAMIRIGTFQAGAVKLVDDTDGEEYPFN